ncbi:MAG: Fur family transcriptional regulator [Clostridiaceae bacterium]
MSNLSSKQIENIKGKIKSAGYKLTLQRRSVLDTMILHEGKHLTIEELYDIVKEGCPEIGLATVYRTMQLLEDISVVSKLNLNDGCLRYELVHEGEYHHHHHLICTKCGKVIEVEGDLLEPLETSIQNKYDFKIINHSVKFYGLCSECIKK